MNKQFSVIRLYRNLDKWKNLYRKQINIKHNLKLKYFKLHDDYKSLLVKNVELKSEVKNLKHTR